MIEVAPPLLTELLVEPVVAEVAPPLLTELLVEPEVASG